MNCTRLYQRGTVVGLEGDLARIEFEPIASCAACAGGRGCGFAPIAGFVSGRRSSRLAIDISGQPIVGIGDTVRVGIDAGRFLWLVFSTYVLPLVGFIIGAVLIATVVPGAGDVGALLGAMVGGLLAVGLLLASAGRRGSLAWLGARITRLG